MVTRRTYRLPYHTALLEIAFVGLVCWSTRAPAGDNNANAVEKLEPIVVTGQKSANAADEKLRKQVQTALRNDPVCYDYHIKVTVEDGVVTLQGFVTDAADMSDAIRISRRIPGVTRVKNTLELVGQGSDG